MGTKTRTKPVTVAERAKSVPERIRTYVATLPEGEPFTVRELLTFGPRTAVDQAISRMARAGELERPARGVYARPKMNPVLGRKVPVTPEQVVAALARSNGTKFRVHGAEAARRFGLTTQMPLRPVYATTGRSRRVKVGSGEVVLRHASPQRMELAGRPAGEALAALLYLGKSEVTVETVQRIREALGAEEFEALGRSVTAMPAWLSGLMRATTDTAHG